MHAFHTTASMPSEGTLSEGQSALPARALARATARATAKRQV
jgi:hypothetical protein